MSQDSTVFEECLRKVQEMIVNSDQTVSVRRSISEKVNVENETMAAKFKRAVDNGKRDGWSGNIGTNRGPSYSGKLTVLFEDGSVADILPTVIEGTPRLAVLLPLEGKA